MTASIDEAKVPAVVRFARSVYDILDITPPKVVDGHKQDPMDGVSMVDTFDDAKAKEPSKPQYSEIMGSRGIYHDGWYAMTFGPRTPWIAELPDISQWDPMQDQWELYDIRTDYSLMNDLAAENSKKLEELKTLFMKEAEENQVLPIGGGLFSPFNSQEMKRSTNTEWTLFEGMTRIPESQAPNVRNGNIRAEIEAEVPENVNGVIFAMGGYAGGVSLYAENGKLFYEYSALMKKAWREIRDPIMRVPVLAVRRPWFGVSLHCNCHAAGSVGLN